MLATNSSYTPEAILQNYTTETKKALSFDKTFLSAVGEEPDLNTRRTPLLLATNSSYTPEAILQN
ncbi:hypothetical protein, partial [Vibrio cortegadensis]